MEPALRRLLPVLLVVCAIAAATIAAGGGGLAGHVLPPPQQDVASPPQVEPTASPSAPPAARRAASSEPAQLPAWLEVAVTAIFILILVGTIGLFLYAGLRYLLTERVGRRELVDQAASQPGGRLESEQLRQAVRAGLADLDAGGDPRRAVIACWLRLERIAAAAGTARLAADTPADLVARLLAAHRVSDRALDQLASAYRLARYAPVEVGDELLTTARAALADIDAALSAAAQVGADR